ncbi:4-hydroxy-tetrahydrodipicolinate synthase [Priestia megaterium]|nr:4-hydroxy-tetrahydrodipicolinate synthase [Priestia megaterium]
MECTFGRVITAMVTPFNKFGEVDYTAVSQLVMHLINNGSDGIVVAGTTGESPTLSKEEKLRLFRRVKEVAGEKISVIANIGNNNTLESAAFAKQVEEETNVDGLLVVNPYYNKPNQKGLYEHFKTIAEATQLPIMLYNIPGRTSVNLEAHTTIRLSSIPNIVAVKESSGNLDQMAAIIEGADDTFKLYSGDDNLSLPVVAIGGYGVVSVASHFVGKEIQHMIKQKDAAMHRCLLPFFQVLFVDTNPIVSKHLLNGLGYNVGETRLPLTPLSQADKIHVQTVYDEIRKKLKEIPINY